MPRLTPEQRRARDERIDRENAEAIAASIREDEERKFRERVLAEFLEQQAWEEAMGVWHRANRTVH
jgi:hypothetical protein